MKDSIFTKNTRKKVTKDISVDYKDKVAFRQIRNASLNGDIALQGGDRPVLIVQNPVGCVHSPRIWVIPLTTRTEKGSHLPMHVFVPKTLENGLKEDSVALVEQAQFILKEDIGKLIGYIENERMWECGRAFIKNCPMFEPTILQTVHENIF